MLDKFISYRLIKFQESRKCTRDLGYNDDRFRGKTRIMKCDGRKLADHHNEIHVDAIGGPYGRRFGSVREARVSHLVEICQLIINDILKILFPSPDDDIDDILNSFFPPEEMIQVEPESMDVSSSESGQ